MTTPRIDAALAVLDARERESMADVLRAVADLPPHTAAAVRELVADNERLARGLDAANAALRDLAKCIEEFNGDVRAYMRRVEPTGLDAPMLPNEVRIRHRWDTDGTIVLEKHAPALRAAGKATP